MERFKRELTIGLGVGIGVLLMVAVGTYFAGSSLSARAERIQSLRTEIVARTSAVESLAALTAEANRAEPYLGLMKSFLPTPDQAVAFSKTVKNLAAARKLTPTFAFKDEVAPTADALGFLTFHLSLGGTPSNLQGFLADLAASSYLVRIDTIDVKLGSSPTTALTGRVFTRNP